MGFLDDVTKLISNIPFVAKAYDFVEEELQVKGKVSISFKELAQPLEFEVVVFKCYPLKYNDADSIKFKNTNLLEYKHVMEDGVVCIHTTHHTNLKSKLNYDFNSLKNWIVKYYINKDQDDHYEHIIVDDKLINNRYWSYQFTDLEHSFEKGEFGEVSITSLQLGTFKGNLISNHIIQSFIRENGEQLECEWSQLYKNMNITNSGAYVYIETPPATYGKFIFTKWLDLQDHLPEKFLNFLLKFQKRHIEHRGKLLPLFFGYKIDDTNIHWQVAMLEIGDFPIIGYQLPNKEWITIPKNELEINWGITRNSSYKYFFGRGLFSQSFVEKKILIIGVGALGSMVAKTLTRCGCKFIDIADNDIKEPENVCRSEYLFNTGLMDKTEELKFILSTISPFVETNIIDKDYFQGIIKLFHKEKGGKSGFETNLNKYDLVIDCTTDNDLMYILNSLDLKCDLINLSITNFAKELVCAFYPNTYNFVMNQFMNVLENDTTDLYNPTGCWSPTFKASYNDISLLVQMAIKHIHSLYETGARKNNFAIESDLSNLNIIEY
ncbi:thiamine biosynthesis protein ThiF [Rasiella rasia]|uniref:Thiamine biosynthesis protein ThiF n=1 Tax=Rasiella rasia TaxID=2744027 RepID=A0A6G6GLC4_9FLAO|nr:ThiF family adenylyltransferase [Rasiella rasia]QIE59290.1 thiamine biosynthesis protein ThiF [Rasiella rasia]